MKHRIFSLLLTAALTGLCSVAHAEKADRTKPMNIEADALVHDELKQVSVFTGRVVMTKGTIVLRGARMEVRQDASGFKNGVVTAEAGQRAFFRQKRDAVAGMPDEYVEGEGETIEYDGRADTVRFIKRAELRRYRGATLSDEVTGAVVVYNSTTDVFHVDGKPGGNASPAAAGSRIRMVLSPKETASAPAPAAPTPLRASPQLSSEGAR